MNPVLECKDNLPEPYRSIMMHLHLIIESVIPEIELKYKWRLPFYYLDNTTMFCF
ncbi:MAG: hypothetical protein ABF274_04915 [Nonlabens sp.]|uniref:hypothetical protein n=1 Tax=Nonlabens sp. TaxID=1888209 RepID=UPI00321C02E5